MLNRLVGLTQRCLKWLDRGPAACVARSIRSRSWSIETLELRQLLSASGAGHAVHVASEMRLVTPKILNGTPTDGFSSVAMVGKASGYNGSGTLIAPQWILTAAHLSTGLENTAGRVEIGGVTYTTEAIFVHPNYSPRKFNTNKANDIALWKLSEPVVGVDPSPIYRQKPQTGALLTLVGFGSGGSLSGETGDFGTKRVGTTPLDRVASTRLRWVFNQSTESNTGHGDSGGPAFIKVGETYYVAGLTSGGTKYNAGRGDRAFDTRVDAFQTWIDDVMEDSVDDTQQRSARAAKGRRAAAALPDNQDAVMIGMYSSL